MKYHDLTQQPDKGPAIAPLVTAICDRLDLDFAAYVGVNPVDRTTSAFANYPDAWRAHYKENALHQRDPSLLLALKSQAPVSWERLADRKETQGVFLEARDFGLLETGITIPIRGLYGDQGLLSAATTLPRHLWKKQLKEIMPDLHREAALLHDAAMQAGSLMATLSGPQLSTREIEILQWLSAGKQLPDISAILTIPERTINIHVQSVCTKLSALNVPQAIARAICLRIITPGA